MGVTKLRVSRSVWKGAPQRVTVPYAKTRQPPEGYLSRSGHVESRLNLRGPSRKAKYSLTTDSGLSRVTERWEEPLLGEDTEPETMCLQAVGAPCIGRCGVTACLLHNDPASYRLRRFQVKAFRAGAAGKPSLNRATESRAVDAKLRDLPMGRLKRGLYRVEDRTHLG